jgi:regulatory protein munI
MEKNNQYDSVLLSMLGEKIKNLRKEKGISQEKFALSIEMDRTYYSTVENGKRNISIQNLNKIAKGLGISISELLEGVSDGEEKL